MRSMLPLVRQDKAKVKPPLFGGENSHGKWMIQSLGAPVI